jgi:hypothetical protein
MVLHRLRQQGALVGPCRGWRLRPRRNDLPGGARHASTRIPRLPMSIDPANDHHPGHWSVPPGHQGGRDRPLRATASSKTPSITDAYADLLNVLSPQERNGLIAQLSVG